MEKNKNRSVVWGMLVIVALVVFTGDGYGKDWQKQDFIDLWNKVRTAVVAKNLEEFNKLTFPPDATEAEKMTQENFPRSVDNWLAGRFPEWESVKLLRFEQNDKAALFVLLLPQKPDLPEEVVDLVAYRFSLTEDGWKLVGYIDMTGFGKRATEQENQQLIEKHLQEDAELQLTPGKLAVTKKYMRDIGTLLSSYQIDTGSYPKVSEEQDLTPDLAPEEYGLSNYRTDAWDKPFRYMSDGKSYRLISYGADKAKGKTGNDDLNADIVYENGEFRE